MTDDPINARLQAAEAMARQAGALALDFYRRRHELLIESKGPQDLVSQADRAVEQRLRDQLAADFPEDAILGEEFGRTGNDGAEFTWVIDPIDGTANFVAGIPVWCVVLACVQHGRVVIGIIFDPNHDDLYRARRGGGATLNGDVMRVATANSVRDGSVAIGYCNRVTPATLLRVMTPLLEAGGVFFRDASGAMMLAYVASGRLLAYHEGHMNPWDCLAGLLMIEEAGGRSWPFETPRMLGHGDAILAGTPAVVDQIEPWARFTRDLPDTSR
jgi:myo-inositol-1(or 4)-monophosphatase